MPDPTFKASSDQLTSDTNNEEISPETVENELETTPETTALEGEDESQSNRASVESKYKIRASLISMSSIKSGDRTSVGFINTENSDNEDFHSGKEVNEDDEGSGPSVYDECESSNEPVPFTEDDDIDINRTIYTIENVHINEDEMYFNEDIYFNVRHSRRSDDAERPTSEYMGDDVKIHSRALSEASSGQASVIASLNPVSNLMKKDSKTKDQSISTPSEPTSSRDPPPPPPPPEAVKPRDPSPSKNDKPKKSPSKNVKSRVPPSQNVNQRDLPSGSARPKERSSARPRDPLMDTYRRDISENYRHSFYPASFPDLALEEYYTSAESTARVKTQIYHSINLPKKPTALSRLRKTNRNTVKLLTSSLKRLRRKNKRPEAPVIEEPHATRPPSAFWGTITPPQYYYGNVTENERIEPYGPFDRQYSLMRRTEWDEASEDSEWIDPADYTEAQRVTFQKINCLNELMGTERTYNRDLSILCSHFFNMIQETKCITPEQCELLIRNGPDILKFQDRFGSALQKAIGKKVIEEEGFRYQGDVKRIAQCFIEWAPEFDIYRDYCVRHDIANEMYSQLVLKNKVFSTLVERLQTFHRVSYGFNKLKFDDYLIIPVQRIFRYKLLLESLSKTIKKESEEYDLLMQAIQGLHLIAAKINHLKSSMEAQRKTNLFLSRLEDDWCLPRRWFPTLGCCILIGTLEVRYGDSKPRRYGCILFDHYMIMAKAKKYEQYEPKHWFPLRIFDVDDYYPNSTDVHSFLLHNDEHMLELTTYSEAEKDIWLDNLRQAIQNSKDVYENSGDTNEYLIEQFFVSSFDQQLPRKRSMDVNGHTQHPLPSGSASLSQSAIFRKSSKANNRASHPVYTAQDFSMTDMSHPQGAKSPGLLSQTSIYDFKDIFSLNVTEWTQRRSAPNHTRWKSADLKFEDVCSTPILTARKNSLSKSRKGSFIQANRDESAISPLFSPATTNTEAVPSNASSRRPSLHETAQRRSSLHRFNSTKSVSGAAAGLLPPSKSTLSLSGRSSKFFGKVVEKLSQIGTPSRMRRQNALSENKENEGESSKKKFSKYLHPGHAK